MKPTTMFAMMLTVVLSVETASAQFVCYPVLPPPRIVIFTPQPVVWRPISVIIPVLVTEDWREVGFCNVSYSLNGVNYHVDTNGQHFQLKALSSDCVQNKFVEPFLTGTHLRAVKQIHDVPQGASSRYQDGVKTVFIVGGRKHFPTWVQVGGVIRTVWCQRNELLERGEPVREYSPTPAPAFQQGLETQPPALIVPPAPAVQLLVPQFDDDEDPFETELTPKPQSYQRSEEESGPRLDGPVAQRIRI